MCACAERPLHVPPGGPLHRQGRPHVARVGSHHHHLPPPTSWISRCLSHSGPRQPPAPPACSREHSQFTLCLLTLVTFTADELFVVLPQPTRLKHTLISRKLLRHEAPAATTGNPGPRFAHNRPPHVLPGVVCVECYFFLY